MANYSCKSFPLRFNA